MYLTERVRVPLVPVFDREKIFDLLLLTHCDGEDLQVSLKAIVGGDVSKRGVLKEFPRNLEVHREPVNVIKVVCISVIFIGSVRMSCEIGERKVTILIKLFNGPIREGFAAVRYTAAIMLRTGRLDFLGPDSTSFGVLCEILQ